MKAALYVFAYAGVTGGTHLSVTRDIRDWPELEHGIVEADSLIDRARGRAASHFLIDENMGDVMLMVDHDISWQKGDLRYLAERCFETKGIVSAIYPKRTFNGGLTFRVPDEASFLIGQDRLIDADYVSTGFFAVHREAIAKITKTMEPVIQGFYPMFHPMLVDTEKGHEHISEDWAFCHRARDLGVSVHLAAKPILKHEGSYKYRAIDAFTQPVKDQTLDIIGDSAFIRSA